MAKVTMVVRHYHFNQPPIPTKEEFISFKQILQIEPSYDLAPKMKFWDEFIEIKWGFLLAVIGIPISLILPFLSFIPMILMFLLFWALIGNWESMWNYQSFLNKKNKYFKILKQSIMQSKDYETFKNLMKQLT